MQSNYTYLASAAIKQYDLLTIDTSATSDLALYAKPAGEGDPILGRANSKVSIGEPVNFSDLTIGQTITCVAGGNIAAGDHLSCSDGKVVKGTASLVACEAASSGQKLRVVVVAELNNGVDKAKSLELSAAVGSESQGVYFKADGKPYPTTGGGFQVSSLWAHSDAHLPQVGAIALFAFSNGGGTTHYYGDEVTVTRADLSKTDSGLGLMIPDRLAFDWGSRTSGASIQYKTLGSGSIVMPVGTKVRILGGNLDINQGVILGIVTYLPEPTPAA